MSRGPLRLSLHYDSKGGDVRAVTRYQRAVDLNLSRPAADQPKALSKDGTEVLCRIAEQFRSEFRRSKPLPHDRLVQKARSFVENEREEAPASVCPFLDGFIASMEHARCQDCHRSASCDDRGCSVAHSLVENRRPNPPHCLRDLVEEVEAARSMVQEMYAQILHGRRIHIDLVLGRGSKEQRTVMGRTIAGDEGYLLAGKPPQGVVDRFVTITLMIPPLEGDAGALALAYVAAHEMGVHAVERMGNERGPSGDRVNRAFAEGLVDVVVFEAFNERIANEGGKRHLNVAARERHALHLTDGREGDVVPRQIARGRSAFEYLKAIARIAVRFRLLGKAVGPDWARDCVLALNAAPIDETEREDFVLALAILEDSANLSVDLSRKGKKVKMPDGGYRLSTAYELFEKLEFLRTHPGDPDAAGAVVAFCAGRV